LGAAARVARTETSERGDVDARKVGDSLGEARGIVVDETDPHTERGEPPSGGESDVTGRPGDDGDSVNS